MEKLFIALSGVALGAILAFAREQWVGNRDQRKKATYLAIRVVCLFDRYVDGCASVVGDNGLWHGQPDPDGFSQIQVDTPKLDVQSLDVDWKSLPPELMYEVLSFPNLIEEADHRISGAFEHVATPPDYSEGFQERQDQYAKLGINAANLARKLRQRYKLPERSFKTWNPVEYMQEHIQESAGGHNK